MKKAILTASAAALALAASVGYAAARDQIQIVGSSTVKPNASHSQSIIFAASRSPIMRARRKKSTGFSRASKRMAHRSRARRAGSAQGVFRSWCVQ